VSFVEKPPLSIEPPDDIPVYFATLIAGLELIVADEVEQRLPAAQVLGALRGKLVFASPEPPGAALELGTIEHLFAWAGQIEALPTSREGLEVIERELEALDLGPALSLFHRLHGEPEQPGFRITAQRAGNHEYNSVEIAAAAGAGVNRRYGWAVDLTQYDYDVRVYVTDDSALVGLRLSEEALHRRARVRHAAASLNPTVAHAMCRLAAHALGRASAERATPAGRPSGPDGPPHLAEEASAFPAAVVGQVFVDPMCGAGTILIERASLGEVGLLVGGELHEQPLAAARENLAAASLSRPAGRENLAAACGSPAASAEGPADPGLSAALVRWDARRLPLRRGSVDAVACNLPWGRRVGSHRANRHLYPGFMRELGRVLRPGGVAVLLTQEKRLIARLMAKSRKLTLVEQYPLSLSGMYPTIYVLTRTAD